LSVPASEEGARPEQPKRMERAVRCMGEEIRSHLYPFHKESSLLGLSGYVASPLFSRRDFRGVHLFVNGRPVSDRQLLQTVKVAYRTLLEVGRFPVCALNIRIDPSVVDINVHPQKLEVRFSQAQAIQGQIIRLLSDFLATTPWLSQKVDRVYTLQDTQVSSGLEMSTPREDNRAFGFSFPLSQASSDSATSLFGRAPELTQVPVQPGLGGESRYVDLQFIGQVAATYLVLEAENAMVVVDQHAAHERVMFEQFKERAAREGLASQVLLFPLQLNASSAQIAGLIEHGNFLHQFGFEVEPFGERQVLVKSAPVGIAADHLRDLVVDALDELSRLGRADSLDDFRDHICAQLACHGSVRAGQRLNRDEARALLEQLDTIDYSAHCPHGRPVVRAIPTTEIQKWFSRL